MVSPRSSFTVGRAALGALMLTLGLSFAGCGGGRMTPNVPLQQSGPGGASMALASRTGSGAAGKLLASLQYNPALRTVVRNVYSHARPTIDHLPPANSQDLIDHGGQRMPNAGSIDVYVNPTLNPPDAQWGYPDAFVRDFSTSKMEHAVDQYVGAAGENRYPDLGYVTVKGAPKRTWTNADINNTIQAVINSSGSTGYGVIYHIYLAKGQNVCTTTPYPSGCYGTAYCAFHSSGDFTGTVSGHVIFTLEPWQHVSGCNAPSNTIQDDTASDLSHEMSEAFTDPDGKTWYNAAGSEIGDICRNTYGNIPLLPGPVDYDIQKEWLNSEGACAFGPTGFVTEFPDGLGQSFSIVGSSDCSLWYTNYKSPYIGNMSPTGVVTQYSNGISTGNTALTNGPDGNVWYLEYFANAIGRITPTGQVTDFSNGISPNAELNGITTGGDGAVWFTEYFNKKIGRITVDGTVTEFPVGSISPAGITTDLNGNMWFDGGGDGSVGHIGKITPQGVVTEYPLPAGIQYYVLPNGIAYGLDGNVWFAASKVGSNGVPDRIARITPAGVVKVFSKGITPGRTIYALAGAEDGIWFTEYSGTVGRITAKGVVTEFTNGITPNSGLSGITKGADGNLWFTEYTTHNVGRLIDGDAEQPK